MPSTPELSVNFGKDKAMRDGLREPFKPNQIGKIPATKGRPSLDYVGHAAVTDRLNASAPGWTYTVDELLTIEGSCWIRGTMVVGTVARVEFGDGKDPKEAIGNFIRRGAMRFGVALDLWSREELQTSGGSTAADQPTPSPSGQPAPGEVAGPPETPDATSGAPVWATPDQWAKAKGLGMSKVDVLKSVQAAGGKVEGRQVVKASEVTAKQLAELLEAFGVA